MENLATWARDPFALWIVATIFAPLAFIGLLCIYARAKNIGID